MKILINSNSRAQHLYKKATKVSRKSCRKELRQGGRKGGREAYGKVRRAEGSKFSYGEGMKTAEEGAMRQTVKTGTNEMRDSKRDIDGGWLLKGRKEI